MSTTSQKIGTTELLFRCAEQMGLEPSWLSPQGPFAIKTAGGEQYINFARSPLNSHVGSSLAKDKYLTRLILERHKLQNIPFARPRTQAQAAAFLKAHGKIIAKPVHGAGAHDIHIITSVEQLEQLSVSRYILEQYIAGREMRYLVLNSSVIGVHQSVYGTSVQADRALQRISYPQDTWDATLVESSIYIAQALGLKFAAVDYLIDSSGDSHILEVNTSPGLKWFHAPSSGPAVDVARLFFEAMLADNTSTITTFAV
jgi:glutathione synthase/RimK-type ligase-like ATP-grasp enzyme